MSLRKIQIIGYNIVAHFFNEKYSHSKHFGLELAQKQFCSFEVLVMCCLLKLTEGKKYNTVMFIR